MIDLDRRIRVSRYGSRELRACGITDLVRAGDAATAKVDEVVGRNGPARVYFYWATRAATFRGLAEELRTAGLATVGDLPVDALERVVRRVEDLFYAEPTEVAA